MRLFDVCSAYATKVLHFSETFEKTGITMPDCTVASLRVRRIDFSTEMIYAGP
jgi:hypothetical protein